MVSLCATATRPTRRAILKPGWEASDCRVGENGPTRVTVGTDGVMVPVITEAEKRKRRENVRRRGQVRRKRSGSKKAKRSRTRGSDPGYKEFKIVAFYDQSRGHQHVAGTCGDHQVLGRLARREACRLNFGRADEKVSVTDGGLLQDVDGSLEGQRDARNVRNAQAVMALAALEHSGLWKTYWNLQGRLAA